MRQILLALTIFFTLLALPSHANSLRISVFDGHHDYLQYSRSYSAAWLVLEQAAAQKNIQIDAYEEAWIRAITFLRERKGVTAVFGAMPSAERKEWTSFSPPLAIEHIAAYVQINSPLKSYEQLISDKHKYNVGVTRGSIHLDVAEQLGFPYIVTFTKRKKLFDMLKHNKLDAIIYTHALTHYYCSKVFNIKGGQCVRQLGTPIENSTLHFVYDRNHQATSDVVTELNLAIEDLRQNGTIAKLFAQKGYSKADYEFWQTHYDTWQKERAQ